jgi:hypothetical protein
MNGAVLPNFHMLSSCEQGQLQIYLLYNEILTAGPLRDHCYFNGKCKRKV